MRPPTVLLCLWSTIFGSELHEPPVRHAPSAATPKRPLPDGLRVCEECGQARGRTPQGAVSACFCSGLICNRCGGRERRPISDYYEIRDGLWSHVPTSR